MPKSSASSPGEGGSLPSSIHCYPYLQEHKKTGKKAGNREMFCEGTNILIDFSKVNITAKSYQSSLLLLFLFFNFHS
jgi:hypothetical protein